MVFDIPEGISGSSYNIYLHSTGICYFDDFRIQPIDAAMSSYVYDKHTGDLTAILDNNNIASKFVYDDAGRLKETYKETGEGFKIVSKHDMVYKDYLYAVPKSYTFDQPAVSSFTFNVLYSVANWHMASKPSWIDVVHEGTDYLEISVQENTTGDTRSGEIVFSSNELNSDVIVPVEQYCPSLTVNPSYKDMAAEGITEFFVTVNSSGELWDVPLNLFETDVVDVYQTSGIDGQFKITWLFPENPPSSTTVTIQLRDIPEVQKVISIDCPQ